MIKRIAVTLFISGAGHLFSVFALKFVAQHSSHSQLSEIGKIDAMVQFIIAVLAMGIQSFAMRNIVTTENWKKEYYEVQTARFTFGICMGCLSIFGLLVPQYFLFAIAPILALNSDYSLYARGFPVVGALIAFIRVFIPFLVIVLLALFSPQFVSMGYLLAIIMVYFVTNIFISKYLKAKTFYFPNLKSLLLYFDSLPLGIVLVAYYFLGLGLLLVANYFYEEKIIAIAFIGLKFYVVYKGILRVIHQAFMRDMVHESVCLKVDQISILAGLLFAGTVLIFPESFISIFFGKQFLHNRIFFMLLAIAAFVFSIFLSMTTKSLLEKLDTVYMKISLIAVVGSFIMMVVLYWVDPSENNIAIGLLTGESFFALGLCVLAKEKNFIMKRLNFSFLNACILLIPLGMRIFMGDNYVSFVIGMLGAIGIMFVIHFRKFLSLY